MCLHFLVPSTEKKSGFHAVNSQEFFCVHLCPMTLLTVKVLFNLLGILLFYSFFFCSKFYQRVIGNKGCWILDWILFLFPVFTSFIPHITFNVQDITAAKTQWWKQFFTHLSFETCGLTEVVLKSHLLSSFLFIPPLAGAFSCEVSCLCCRPIGYIIDGSLAGEMLLQVDHFQTRSHTQRKANFAPVHYIWSVQADLKENYVAFRHQ